MQAFGAAVEAGVDVGEAGLDVGEVGFDIGEVGLDVGEAGFEVGEAGFEVGEAGLEVGEVGFDVGECELPGRGAVAPGWVKVMVQLPNPSPSTPRVTVTLAAPGALVGFSGLRDLYAVPEA